MTYLSDRELAKTGKHHWWGWIHSWYDEYNGLYHCFFIGFLGIIIHIHKHKIGIRLRGIKILNRWIRIPFLEYHNAEYADTAGQLDIPAILEKILLKFKDSIPTDKVIKDTVNQIRMVFMEEESRKKRIEKIC